MTQSRKAWRIERWPPLAWLETVLKLAGMWFGFAALFSALQSGRMAFPAGPVLFRWIVLVVLSVGLLVAIGDRLKEREIVAMVFVVLNNIAHWGMVIGVMVGTAPGLAAFAAFFLAGDLVKLVFLRLHRFQVRDIGPGTLYALTGIYILGYAIILISLRF